MGSTDNPFRCWRCLGSTDDKGGYQCVNCGRYICLDCAEIGCCGHRPAQAIGLEDEDPEPDRATSEDREWDQFDFNFLED
jgi:hypothetical protein